MAPAKALNAKMLENLLNNCFSSFEEKLKSMIEEESETKSKVLKNEFEEVKKSLLFFEERCEDLIKENKVLKKEVLCLTQENVAMKAKVVEVERCSQNAMIKVNEIDNHLRLNNIELHGVSVTDKENVGKVALSILKVTDPSVTERDFEFARRIGSPKKKDGTPRPDMPILVKFHSSAKRMQILKNKKKLAGHNFNSIGVNAKRVFINENLTAYSKALFYQANSIRKENGWKFIWTINGNINLRKDEEARVTYIRCEEDLKKITK